MAIAERDAYPHDGDLEDKDAPLTFAPAVAAEIRVDALDMFGFPIEDGAPGGDAGFFAPQGAVALVKPQIPADAPATEEADIWSGLKDDDFADVDNASLDTRAARAMAAAVEPPVTEPEPSFVTDFAAPPEPQPVDEDRFIPAPAIGGGAMLPPLESELGDLLAPRIAIHLFCRNADTAAAATRAAADRRMQRATPKVVRGGITEATAIYQEQPTPPLLVIECLESPRELLAKLEALAEVCDPSTKVVIIGVANDIALYRELIRRGVSEYLVPPIDPLQLIQTIAGLYADPASAFVGRTLAFIGAKGGVGASTVAHNVAYALAEQIEVNTVVVDYDLPFGTAGLDFNQDPLQGIHDALSQPDRLDPVLLDRMTARCTERLSLFAAPASLEETYEIDQEAYEEVFNSIRTTAPFVVLDLPHQWTGWIRQTLLTSDDVIIVATPDLASLRNAKNMLDQIRKVRPNDTPPKLVLNQMGMPGRPEIPVKEFAKALQIEPSLVLPFDPKLFGEAANNGQMLAELNPKAKSVEGLLQFAQGLARREAPAAPVKTRSLLERLLKRN